MTAERLRLCTVNGADLPRRIYGTAVRSQIRPPDASKALSAGYRALDTASTRRAHDEARDGRLIRGFLDHERCALKREDLFIQSKYTPAWAHSEPWPYELDDEPRIQVLKSMQRSLKDLGLEYVDAYLLHQPLASHSQTMEVWKAMEEIHSLGGARYLGICHVDTKTLESLFAGATIKPHIVQNRFTRRNNFDQSVIEFCRQRSIVYQAFGVLGIENIDLLSLPEVMDAARATKISLENSWCCILLASYSSLGLDMCIIDGSSDYEHMKVNIEYEDFNPIIQRGMHITFLERLRRLEAK